MTEEEHLAAQRADLGAVRDQFPSTSGSSWRARLRPRLQALRLPRYLDYYLQLGLRRQGEREFSPR